MENCPFSGLPCPHKKCIHVTEVNSDYTAASCKDMCVFCGVPYASQDNPSALQTEVTSVFELINNVIKEKQLGQAKNNIKTCPSCGFTIHDIANTSRMGCGDCYTHFKEELEPFIAKYHNSLKHVGKIPKTRSEKPKTSIEELQKHLDEAIKKEDYELAIKLRNDIKNLK
jgi:protein-arginine kinase activator protein McsA